MPFTLTMPKLSPTMEEGTIAHWHKKEGDFVPAGAVIIEIATDKATLDFNVLDEGWLRKILVQEGQSAQVNQAIAIFSSEQNEDIENYKPEGIVPTTAKPVAVKEPLSEIPLPQPAFTPTPIPELSALPSESRQERILASPLARRLAKEKNLDLSTVQGTGPNSRIMSRDLERAQARTMVAFGRSEKPTHAAGAYEEVPLSPLRKIIAKRLQESKSFIPHFYLKITIDAGNLVELREQLKNLDIDKISFNDLIIRACALALREHPGINCGFNSASQSIIYFKTIDISVAVTLTTGLITPIIRYADYKNLGQIAIEMRQLAKKARDGKLAEHEYRGGSFCISNLGMYGISEFSAVINPPQAAILAVGSIEDQPVLKNQQICPGKTLALTLSVDHRVIDGAPAAQFLNTLKKILENPAALVI